MGFKSFRERPYWRILIISLVVIIFAIIQFDWITLTLKNVQWTNIVKELTTESGKNHRKYENLTTVQGGAPAGISKNWGIDEISYVYQLTYLASLESEEFTPDVVSTNSPEFRGLVFLWSLIRLCDQRNGELALSTTTCNIIVPIAGNKLLDHELLPELHRWNCLQIMEWLVLSREVNNSQQRSYWESRLKMECSERFSAYQKQNTNIKIQQAEALGRLGLMDRAIAQGENALKDTHWHWGHFIISQFYKDVNDTNKAEAHLLEAISLGAHEDVVVQYYFSLAEVYENQNRPKDAASIYCKVMNQEPETIFTHRLKPLAEIALGRIFGDNLHDVASYCTNA